MSSNLYSSIACDFGSSGGKIFLSEYDGNKMTLKEAHRFPINYLSLNGRLYTDTLYMYGELLKGIKKIVDRGIQPSSLGINSWGVDYGYISKNGELLSNPINYRDTRTLNTIKKLESIGLGAKELYKITGVSYMPYNSVLQIYEDLDSRDYIVKNAETLLFTPDLFSYFLTGVRTAEYTIASTSGFMDIKKRDWSYEILKKIRFPKSLLPSLIEPGSKKGIIKKDIAEYLGCKPFEVFAVASHDTASAVVSTPLKDKTSAFLSCGSWSLLGVELEKPILTDEAFNNGFTNEIGFNRTIRFLESINGLWILQLLQKKYSISFNEMESFANDSLDSKISIDVNDDRFYNPFDIEKEIIEYCKENEYGDIKNKGEIIASVYNGLSNSYAKSIKSLNNILKENIKTLNIIGGGSKDKLICRLTKEKSNCNVYVGPVECTAIGNILVQFNGLGIVKDVKDMRGIVNKSFNIENI